jgi:hypothetical protein
LQRCIERRKRRRQHWCRLYSTGRGIKPQQIVGASVEEVDKVLSIHAGESQSDEAEVVIPSSWAVERDRARQQHRWAGLTL